MKITFVTELGEAFVVEIDSSMELENVMALLEVEVSVQFPLYIFQRSFCTITSSLQSGIPIHEQNIEYQGRELTNPKATMAQLGLSSEALLAFRRKVATVGGRWALLAPVLNLR
jgi:DNA damage-inducible protein 1